MVPPFTLGILVVFVAATLAVAARRAPTHRSCPQCGTATLAVRGSGWAWRSLLGAWLRWCPACSWEGWGRRGPEWTPGHPISHDSGFFWGAARSFQGPAFRFRESPSRSRAPAAPQAFRWGPEAAERTRRRQADFSWADPS